MNSNWMNGNLRLGQLFGIPFFVNPSWFLVLALATFAFAGEFGRLRDVQALGNLAVGGAIALGLTTTLLLFASVLAHELGHSAVAIAQGIKVKSITLFIFGGLALLEKDAQTPMKSLAIALAGPLVSFGLFFLLTLAQLSFNNLPIPIVFMLTSLASINLVLGVFNLIPGMPLDGGNALRAIVWQFTGNASTGLLYASRMGQVFGGFAIALGILGVLGISPYGSLWTAFIGWFLLQNAGLSAQSAQVQGKLQEVTVQDALIEGSVVPGTLSLRGFVNNYVIGKTAIPLYVVTGEAGQFLGLLKSQELNAIATSLWTEMTLLDVLRDRPAEDENYALAKVQASQSLLEVVPIIEQNPEQPLLVVDAEQQVCGLLTKQSIQGSLLNRQDAPKAEAQPQADSSVGGK